MRVINADVLFSILHDKMKGAEEWRRISKNDAAVECANTAYDTLYNLKMEIEDEVETIEEKPVRRGRWITKDGIINCSVCNDAGWSAVPYEALVKHFNFCPNCGAKMEGVAGGPKWKE